MSFDPILNFFATWFGSWWDRIKETTAQAAHRRLLKIKLGGDGDGARIKAVRQAAPDCELIVDANEAWTLDNLEQHLAACADAGVICVEQPLPAGRDEARSSRTGGSRARGSGRRKCDLADSGPWMTRKPRMFCIATFGMAATRCCGSSRGFRSTTPGDR